MCMCHLVLLGYCSLGSFSEFGTCFKYGRYQVLVEYGKIYLWIVGRVAQSV